MLIPVGDETPVRRISVVNWAIIGLNVLVFLYELLLGQRVDQFFMEWGAVPAYLSNPWAHPMAWTTLISSMFMHGGWSHIIGNMLYLWIFGDNVEDALGHVGYALFYMGAGIVAGLAQVVIAPSSTVPGIGASGAIAGVLAVYVVLYPRAPVRVLVPLGYVARIARLPALLVLGFWFVLQLFNGFLGLGTMNVATGGVAYFAHIGGFLAGLVVGFVVRLLGRGRQAG